MKRGKVLQRIDSLQNHRVRVWKKLKTKKGRNKQGAFLIEGEHLVEEALRSNVKVMTIIIDETRVDIPFLAREIPIVQVSKSVFREISDTDTPQGIIAVCEKPKETLLPFSEGKFLLLDEVQDPGNVGTMIRTADCAGFDAVILGKGCADLYNPKTIRSTQGSLFHLPVFQQELAETIQALKKRQITVFGTALKKATDYRRIEKRSSFALLVGNEGSGVKPQYLELCDENVYIPIYGQAESLNVAVAAGILMYSLQ